MMRGLLVIISSPSGGGKTTVINEILKKRRQEEFKYSISATTRNPRPGELNGKDYIFYSESEFLERAKRGGFLEWEQVHQYYYGTPKNQIEQWLSETKVVLLDVDVNGGLQIKQQYSQNAISIFIAPPSKEKLIERLKKRKTDSIEEINKRLERIPLEMNKKNQFDYVIVNDKLEDTVKQVIKIIDYHKRDEKK